MKLYLYTLVLAALCPASNAAAQNIAWTKKCSSKQKETYVVAFSPDGSKVFSGSEHLPTSVRVFDTWNANLLWDDTLVQPLMCAQDVGFSTSGSKLMVLEEYGNLMIYDFTTPKPSLLTSVKMPGSYAFGISMSPDDKKMAIGCSGKKLVIYDMDNDAYLHMVDAHTNYVNGTDWSVNEQVATCGDDMLVKLWDTAGNHIRTFTGHSASVTYVKFTPDGSKLVSCSRDNTIKIWDVATGNLLKTLTGHSKIVKRLDISDDGTTIVSGSEDETIKTWDIATGTLIKSFGVPGCGIVYSVDFMPGSKRHIAAGTGNGDVQLWDMLFATNIQAENKMQLDMYPNPCTDYVRIHTGSEYIRQVLVTDVSGKMVSTVTVNAAEITIDMKQLPAGMYYIQAVTDNNNYTGKVFKQ